MFHYLHVKRAAALACIVLLCTALFSLAACAQQNGSSSSTPASTSAESTAGHSNMTLELMDMLNNDPELKALVEKSIAKAHEINSDPRTNPVNDLDSLYTFTDWAEKCMPWQVIEGMPGDTVYDHIDQSLCMFYFLFDQPLKELEGKGYYYPTLQYHAPIRGWLNQYASNWGLFLASPDSWNDEYYKMACTDESFNMTNGWYGDANIWTSFNDWFARRLVNQETTHPVSKETDVVAPADSAPQGVWKIDANGMFATDEEGVQLKSARFNDIENLLGPDSKYRDSFNSGTFTHTFLDVNDYHRYHFPVSGTIVEVKKIPAVDAAGGITIWDAERHKYVLKDKAPGWQSIETRDLVVVETDEFGLVAILPIAMSQVSSCNWEPSVQVGAHVEKGDPMGYFLFGGSDICMVFQEGVNVNYLATPKSDNGYEHILMGQPLADLSK